MSEKIKCLIIGSGAAGYTAAIYAARADLKPVIYQGLQPGGQLTTTTEVENFPGYPEGVDGTQMMEDFKKQAERFLTDLRIGAITNIDVSTYPFQVKTDDNQSLLAESIIIATGATARYLELPSEDKFKGYGVSACAVCDGFFYKGKIVAVVGGGDSSVEEATYLAKICPKVYLIHRRDELRASKAMQKRAFDTKNLEIVWDSIPIEIIGKETKFSKEVTGVIIENIKTKKKKTLDISGFFVAIGHTPNTDFIKGKIDLDENGYIITNPNSTATNVKGIFAAGDVQDKTFRQAITAAGTGCMAALEVEKFLAEKRN